MPAPAAEGPSPQLRLPMPLVLATWQWRARGMAGGTVGKVVVAAGVAEWVLNGVDQRGEQFVALRMPADIPSEQG